MTENKYVGEGERERGCRWSYGDGGEKKSKFTDKRKEKEKKVERREFWLVGFRR